MITFPNAKINIGLDVVCRRPDGYHDIETIFYPIPIQEALEVVSAPSDTNRLILTGMMLDSEPGENLVMRAYHLLAQDFELAPVEVHLHKAIPFGAGLGGGSADGAFMIKIINEMEGLNLSKEQMMSYASRLGADCAFFIENCPCFAQGIGDQLRPIDLSLKGYFMVLVKPDIHVSTPAAYARIEPTVPEHHLPELMTLPLEEWEGKVKNDFEKNVFSSYPEIGRIKETLYKEGALYAAMSGSGSSVYGIFSKPLMLKEKFPDSYVWEGLLEK